MIDTGLARVKRYSLRNKTTLLQIEKISQAAANQRAGRCGRVADGICVRLYAEDDFAARPRYTDPEILRTSLAAVILRMAALDLGDVEAFPFLEPPAPRAIADGYQLLQELGAVDGERRADRRSGRELARLPVDPRVGRMVLAARERGCLAEVLVIASALSVPDPRERPLEKQQAADQAHLRFRDERSDFLSLLALWEFFDGKLAREARRTASWSTPAARSSSPTCACASGATCTRSSRRELAELGWKWPPALPRDDRRARATRRSTRRCSPGCSATSARRATKARATSARAASASTCTRAPGSRRRAPNWVLAAELVETSRLYARCAARSSRSGSRRSPATASRATTSSRTGTTSAARSSPASACSSTGSRWCRAGACRSARIDPARGARGVHPRGAGARRARDQAGAFLAHNRRLIAEVAELEHKARRQDVLVDDEAIAAFYAERVPADDLHSLAAFERWREDGRARRSARCCT